MNSLQSKEALSLYKKIGDQSLSKLKYIEDALNGRKRNIKICEGQRIFIIMGNEIQYDDFLYYEIDGNYLSIHLEKEIDKKSVDVTLNRGITGFELSTGQRYDRRLSKVTYTYDGETIENLVTKDEKQLEEEEEQINIAAQNKVAQYVIEKKKK